MKKYFSTILVLIICLLLSSCTSGVVPPGTKVIKLSTDGNTETYTSGKYTAFGRDRLYFLDTKLKSFTETMQILCKDNVNMTVEVKWIGCFDDNSKEKTNIIKERVPATESEDASNSYTLNLSKFYETAMADIIRNAGRVTISPYVTDAIPSDREKIEATIRKKVVDKLTSLNYPVTTVEVLISNLDFDPEQTKQRQAIKKAELDDQLKSAEAKASVAQARRDAEIAIERGKAEIETAKSRAAANKIIAESLTPEILLLRQYEAFIATANGPNNEVMIVPYEAINPTNLNAAIIRQAVKK